MNGKNKTRNKTFPEVLMKRWEDSDGINFAIALVRLTGWILYAFQYRHRPNKL